MSFFKFGLGQAIIGNGDELQRFGLEGSMELGSVGFGGFF